MSNSAKVELVLTLHFETEKAYYVSDTGLHSDGKFVPKSQVEITSKKVGNGVHLIEAEMPEWLAADKRFI